MLCELLNSADVRVITSLFGQKSLFSGNRAYQDPKDSEIAYWERLAIGYASLSLRSPKLLLGACLHYHHWVGKSDFWKLKVLFSVFLFKTVTCLATSLRKTREQGAGEQGEIHAMTFRAVLLFVLLLSLLVETHMESVEFHCTCYCLILYTRSLQARPAPCYYPTNLDFSHARFTIIRG